MEKQKKLSETLEKTTTPETQETNFTKYLEDAKDIREPKNILKFMRDNFINTKDVEYINVNDYIYYYSQIPESLWSEKPIFYFKDDKYDALGLLGEQVHYFNIYSKTLQLYFKDCCGLSITECIDEEHKKLNNKEKFIKWLFYIEEVCQEKELTQAFRKAKKIIHGRYY